MLAVLLDLGSLSHCLFQIFYSFVLFNFQLLNRLNGHERDNVQTYGMVAGLLNSGCGLGSMVGPVVSGVITDHSGFTWTMTSFSGVGVIMVSMSRVLYKCLMNSQILILTVTSVG